MIEKSLELNNSKDFSGIQARNQDPSQNFMEFSFKNQNFANTLTRSSKNNSMVKPGVFMADQSNKDNKVWKFDAILDNKGQF